MFDCWMVRTILSEIDAFIANEFDILAQFVTFEHLLIGIEWRSIELFL